MGKELLVFVILDIEAGMEREALDGLAKNLASEVGGAFGPAAIWEVHQGTDLAVELRLSDAEAFTRLDTLLVDKIRTVPGVVETAVRPIFRFRFIDEQGGQKAFDAARADSPEILGVVLCDVECGKDRAVWDAMLKLKPADGVIPVDAEMAFHSVDFDLSLLLVGTDAGAFHRYTKKAVRPLEGVSDTILEVWEIAKVFGEGDEFVAGWAEMAE